MRALPGTRAICACGGRPPGQAGSRGCFTWPGARRSARIWRAGWEEALAIALGCRSPGAGKLATRLENAAPHFVAAHPELHPANGAEGTPHLIAIRRLIGKRHVAEGVRAFGRIDLRAGLAPAGPGRLRRVLPAPADDLAAYQTALEQPLCLLPVDAACDHVPPVDPLPVDLF